MIIKDVTDQKQKDIGVVLPFKGNNIFQIKINKSIEIVIVPNPVRKMPTKIMLVLYWKKIKF